MAVQTVASRALAGSGRPLVIASGVPVVAAGQMATERDGHGSVAPEAVGSEPRRANAELALAYAAEEVRSSVVRVATTTHGAGDHGFIAWLVAIAAERGVSGYVGDGASRWPAVHRLDAARLFRLALEQAPAGSTVHAVADEGVPLREVAEVIGRHLDLPVASIAPEAAGEHFGWLAGLVSLDLPASSALTRELLGWQPAQPGLIEDLELGHYFAGASV